LLKNQALTRGYPGNWVNAVNGVKGTVEAVKVHIEFPNITGKNAILYPDAHHRQPSLPAIRTQAGTLAVLDELPHVKVGIRLP
jgi:hypothetical protein